MQQYNIEGARMKHEGKFLCLTVPGLAEKRPSLLRGDFVLAVPVGVNNLKYQGFIHRVQQDTILLLFAKSFHAQFVNCPYNIEFNFPRRTMKILHQGLNLIEKNIAQDVLYPPFGSGAASPEDLATLYTSGGEVVLHDNVSMWFNRTLNAVQQRAVNCIVGRINARETFPVKVPYVIYGPPGG